ncbi:hypothetical protein [Shinella sp. M31]|uniref:hypothetical protein n=1 Tax=Shinella sp. M31 TaxID=3368615 RepID=UPI003BA0AB18
MNTETFTAKIRELLASAKGDTLTLNAGDIHRDIGGYPGYNHRMPQCCKVMYAEMREGDRVVSAPPKGLGASLTIEYRLPR